MLCAERLPVQSARDAESVTVISAKNAGSPSNRAVSGRIPAAQAGQCRGAVATGDPEPSPIWKQPVYQKSVGRWQHYAPHFEPILDKLAPFVKEFGYASE